MFFQSAGFLFVFLPVFIIFLVYSPPGIIRKILLLFFSYLFYSGSEPFFLILLIISSSFDFIIAIRIDSSNNRNIKILFLFSSIFLNLGLLAIYKYGAMIIDLASQLTLFSNSTFMPDSSYVNNFVLPAGISFYTFQSMSYSIDVFRGVVKPTRDISGFFCYVGYMPQLVAGPIERFNNLYPQIVAFSRKELSGKNYWRPGLDRLCLGIIQKLVIADGCGRLVDLLARHNGTYDLISGWALAIGFGLQIYYDFAAYTSMAIGISLFLGIKLSENFLSPYKAPSIRDFWRRWHVTLSNWFRDYLYIPLGGNRRGATRTIFNIMITFLLCGLWHGAGYNFIIWGGLHGIFLSSYFLIKKLFPHIFVPSFPSAVLTYLAVQIAWVPFRIADTSQVLEIWTGMSGLNGVVNQLVSLPDIVFIALILLFTVIVPNCAKRWPGSSGAVESIVLWVGALLALFNSPQINQFIYFQF